MIWNISWKNVWRNKSRSLVVIAAITLGTIAGVFVAGLMNGWVNQRTRAAIYTEVSHMKLQHPDYLNNEEIVYTVPRYAEVVAYLDQCPEVKAWTKHTKIVAMGNTSRGTVGLTLKGIDPADEVSVSALNTTMVAGSYFETAYKNPIVISEKTADQLRLINYTISQPLLDSLQALGASDQLIKDLSAYKDQRFITLKSFKKQLTQAVDSKDQKAYGASIMQLAKHYKLRSKVVFTFSGMQGDMSYQSFRVCGVYKTNNTMFDQMNAFVPQSSIAQAAGFGERDVHELSILLHQSDDEQLKAFQAQLKAQFPELSVMTWKELAPDAGMMADFMTVYYYIIMGVIFLALAFGIVNTMLMAVLERVKELGMLMAVGMNRRRVFRMIMLETLFLTLVGSVIGMLLGAALIAVFGEIGLNFSAVQEGFEAFGWSALVYPSIEASFFFGVTLMVIVIALLASVVPARKALKLNPVEAIRTE